MMSMADIKAETDSPQLGSNDGTVSRKSGTVKRRAASVLATLSSRGRRRSETAGGDGGDDAIESAAQGGNHSEGMMQSEPTTASANDRPSPSSTSNTGRTYPSVFRRNLSLASKMSGAISRRISRSGMVDGGNLSSAENNNGPNSAEGQEPHELQQALADSEVPASPGAGVGIGVASSIGVGVGVGGGTSIGAIQQRRTSAPMKGMPGSAGQRRLSMRRSSYGSVTSSGSTAHSTASSMGLFAKTFPEKLMDMLVTTNDDPSSPLHSDAIRWLPHGKSFVIADPEKFTRDILPRYFKQTKFKSFTRKLYRWGFRQITKGADAGSYFHELFRRDDPELCGRMTCHYSEKELQTQRDNAAASSRRRLSDPSMPANKSPGAPGRRRGSQPLSLKASRQPTQIRRLSINDDDDDDVMRQIEAAAAAMGGGSAAARGGPGDSPAIAGGLSSGLVRSGRRASAFSRTSVRSSYSSLGSVAHQSRRVSSFGVDGEEDEDDMEVLEPAESDTASAAGHDAGSIPTSIETRSPATLDGGSVFSPQSTSAAVAGMPALSLPGPSQLMFDPEVALVQSALQQHRLSASAAGRAPQAQPILPTGDAAALAASHIIERYQLEEALLARKEMALLQQRAALEAEKEAHLARIGVRTVPTTSRLPSPLAAMPGVTATEPLALPSAPASGSFVSTLGASLSPSISGLSPADMAAAAALQSSGSSSLEREVALARMLRAQQEQQQAPYQNFQSFGGNG